MYREVPPVLSGRTKEKPDKPDIALEQRKAAVLLSVVHRTPIHLPSHPLSPNTPLGPCQNPISSINDMWFKEKACGRTRSTILSIRFLYVYHEIEVLQQGPCHLGYVNSKKKKCI